MEAGQITSQQGHIVDLVPTLLEAAGLEYPQKQGDLEPQPLHGKSLLPVLLGNEVEESPFYLSGWTDKFRMYRQGEWRLVKLNDEGWELYHLSDDPTEMHDLAPEMPEKVKQLEQDYLRDKQKVGY